MRQDDPALAGDLMVYRRIPSKADYVQWDENGNPTPSRQNFSDKDDELSVHIVNETSPEDILEGHDGYGLVQLTLQNFRDVYVDQFGLDDLLKFALWLDHGLGAIRIEKRYVFAEAAVIFLRDGQMNLLDVIAGAFRAQEVVEYLRNHARCKADAIYEHETIAGNGVQSRYKKRVLRYYNQSAASLRGKSAWITNVFIAGNVGQV